MRIKGERAEAEGRYFDVRCCEIVAVGLCVYALN